MKSHDQVISEFNELVNMTASELERWLKSDDSNSAGWPKADGDGESVGHDSGRKIVEVLKSNPRKEADKYTEDQVSHMRKVVSYCKRHLAQEEKANDEKPVEEVKKTKSYASLKNWGHDPLKKREANKDGKESTEPRQEEFEDNDNGEEDSDETTEHTGDKRKAAGDQSGANKKRELRNKRVANTSNDDEGSKDEDDDEEDETGKSASQKKQKGAGKQQSQNGKTADNGPNKGDTVSWNWGNGQPEGKVLDVKAEDTSITTKKGNEVSRKGTKEDPAVVLDTGKSKAIKLSHELNEG
ncbi:hypothetical protein B0T10DRAFT_602108 [Thelonectria olida]|uniref:Hypervirulence associated protein TUDOR domain-containing protein n=1 Tax=Thelonectria olida TaxID=1576542 RepID=A0A9P8WE41_9HYPO|nr:hypothetical protein B0T10DRAFT_602108 [Thelonectria olida]